ncbi:unnamed protein product [Dovyalis caffra]|uniref:Uncharacterized protein n=1 Tax=Dovyalis caffra TaxID=77055 RepID=A0AAV1SMN1_9ROSI|nr:unnamed protein product [Dovyalis caffra]
MGAESLRLESVREENESDRVCSFVGFVGMLGRRLSRDFVRIKKKGKSKEAAKGDMELPS